MGNLQTRKRRAEREDESEHSPYRKRPRLEWAESVEAGPSRAISPTSQRSTLRRKRRIVRPFSNILSLSSSRLQQEDKKDENTGSPPERSLSIGSLRGGKRRVKEENNNAASSCSLSRSQWPVPWLEALFLPEFPARSSTVNENSFQILNEIGRGSFGRVHRVVAKDDSRGVFALKIQDKSSILAREAVEQIKREASIHKHLGEHRFIARLFASWQSRSQLFSVLQYPAGSHGDLFQVWNEYGSFNEDTVRAFGAEIACALDFIHNKGIIYRDLKLENVLVDADGHVKLVDFGLAKQLPLGERTRSICGTLQYMAPEISAEQWYDHSVDWWSYGVLLHVLLTNRYPYPNAECRHHTSLRFIDYSTPIGHSSRLGTFFDKILAVRPEHRLRSFATVHTHPFFRGVDWEEVEKGKYPPMSFIPLAVSMADSHWSAEEAKEEGEEEAFHGFDEHYEFADSDYFDDILDGPTV